MQSQNPFFDDLAKMTTGAMGTLAGMGREMEGQLKEKFREWMGGMDMVSREEFEAVKAMAQNARAEVEALKAEMAAGRTGAHEPTAFDGPPAEPLA